MHEGSIGTVFQVRNWDHCQETVTLKYSMGRQRRGRVVLMVAIGETAQDGSEPVDIDALMKNIGWIRDPSV